MAEIKKREMPKNITLEMVWEYFYANEERAEKMRAEWEVRKKEEAEAELKRQQEKAEAEKKVATGKRGSRQKMAAGKSRIG
jgi:hypothetical protein